jgi:hypothetical protein
MDMMGFVMKWSEVQTNEWIGKNSEIKVSLLSRVKLIMIRERLG